MNVFDRVLLMSPGGGLPLQRGASMTTDKHVDPAAAVPTGDGEEDSNLQDVPEGAVRFELDRGEIEEALAAPSMQVMRPLACKLVRAFKTSRFCESAQEQS